MQISTCCTLFSLFFVLSFSFSSPSHLTIHFPFFSSHNRQLFHSPKKSASASTSYYIASASTFIHESTYIPLSLTPSLLHTSSHFLYLTHYSLLLASYSIHISPH